MSKIGRQAIIIPPGAEVRQEGNALTVKGPQGELSRTLSDQIALEIGARLIKLSPKADSPETKALWGTYASHLRNMIKGVTEGFEKKVVLEGIGYRAALTGTTLTLHLGFSHPVTVAVPAGLQVTVEKNTIVISGPDKEQVGQFAAFVRAYRKPEPYKGKGIRYEGEIVRRKEGKKVVA